MGTAGRALFLVTALLVALADGVGTGSEGGGLERMDTGEVGTESAVLDRGS